MHETITAPDAPVTIKELFETLGETERTWRRRATVQKWPRNGGHAYALNHLPAEIAEKITRRRQWQLEANAKVHEADALAVIRHDKLPTDFTDYGQKLGRAKGDFVLAVEEIEALRPSLHARDCVRAAVIDGSRQCAKWHLALIAVGSTNKNLVSLGDDPNALSFPAYENFRKWSKKWKKFRRGKRHNYQYWVLCDRRDEGAEKRAGKYEQKGNPNFWALFRQRYESTAMPGIEECHRQCRDVARQKGWTNIPSPKQCRYYYEVKLSDAEKRLVEKAREGRKHHYDTCSIYIIRDWRRVEPDECWSFDGHKLDVMVRVWNPALRGWEPERPWLVNAIDSCSWFEVGRHFTMVPAQDSVEYVIRDAEERYRRIAAMLYFDNGREFKAAGKKLVMDERRLNEICDNICVDAMYALPYNPRAKVNERDYRNVVQWFEARQPTYIGNKAVNVSNFDQRWHDLHQPGQPLERDAGGRRLKNPLLVPELKDLAALYDEYRERDHHQRVRTGRICPNQSPAEKYLSATPRRVLEDWEIATSFLRVLGPQTVDEQARVWYLPSGCRKGQEIWYQDEKLMEFRDREVVVKFDIAAMRAFAYQPVRNGDLRMIKCSGEFGSVPREFLPHPFHATQEQIRDKKRTYSRWQRTKRAGKQAERFEVAADELANEAAREQGITPGAAKIYVIKDDDVVARAEGIAVTDNKMATARQRLKSKFTDAQRLKFQTGEVK